MDTKLLMDLFNQTVPLSRRIGVLKIFPSVLSSPQPVFYIFLLEYGTEGSFDSYGSIGFELFKGYSVSSYLQR